MKMVKSLLLGSAAGLVAVAGAQAADLPVKAKPVEYVKICSLYGAGFYYIPGTDMCLKIGGWVRLEIAEPYNGSMTTGPFAGDVNNRNTNNLTWRSRGYITADARNQTEYGTVRSYIALGLCGNDNANTSGTASVHSRAGVQFEPRLHPVGGLHCWFGDVVLRLLQLAGDGLLRLLRWFGHRRRWLEGVGLHCAVR